mmetsp:Transcript_93766/g.264792  ORF Transcript_93766/g.264792 Transcript_93766/m.264792 type:complete len:394 (+) Transcript_93766:473-1654(+)
MTLKTPRLLLGRRSRSSHGRNFRRHDSFWELHSSFLADLDRVRQNGEAVRESTPHLRFHDLVDQELAGKLERDVGDLDRRHRLRLATGELAFAQAAEASGARQQLVDGILEVFLHQRCVPLVEARRRLCRTHRQRRPPGSRLASGQEGRHFSKQGRFHQGLLEDTDTQRVPERLRVAPLRVGRHVLREIAFARFATLAAPTQTVAVLGLTPSRPLSLQTARQATVVRQVGLHLAGTDEFFLSGCVEQREVQGLLLKRSAHETARRQHAMADFCPIHNQRELCVGDIAYGGVHGGQRSVGAETEPADRQAFELHLIVRVRRAHSQRQVEGLAVALDPEPGGGWCALGQVARCVAREGQTRHRNPNALHLALQVRGGVRQPRGRQKHSHVFARDL